jgi:hypothetical protein
MLPCPVACHGVAVQVSLGHSTLSHTYTHPDLLLQTSEGIYNEFAKTNAAFVKSGVCKRPTLYRPPYGNTNATITDLTGRMGMRGIIWTIDTLDWSLAKSNPTKMLADFKTSLAATGSAGVIHLQHDLLLESVNLVPQLLATIKANTPKKDAFISIEQCVWGPGYLTHPSYVFMNRLCPATISKWPAVTTGCPVSDWSAWSPCDSNCGPGVSYVYPDSLPSASHQLSTVCAPECIFARLRVHTNAAVLQRLGGFQVACACCGLLWLGSCTCLTWNVLFAVSCCCARAGPVCGTRCPPPWPAPSHARVWRRPPVAASSRARPATRPRRARSLGAPSLPGPCGVRAPSPVVVARRCPLAR